MNDFENKDITEGEQDNFTSSDANVSESQSSQPSSWSFPSTETESEKTETEKIVTDSSSGWSSTQQTKQNTQTTYGYATANHQQPYNGQDQANQQPGWQGAYPRNAYPPNPQNAYGTQGYQQQPNNYYAQSYTQPNYGQSSYQYNTSSGWQQPKPEEKYEWKFEDYQKLDTKKNKKKKNRGLVVFTVVLLCLLSIGLIGLASYSIYSATIGEDMQTEPETDQESSSGHAAIEIKEKPEITESLPVGGKMSIPQVAKAVLPSVVGVIKYDNDQFYQVGGMGSGIILTEDGYIITNAHVVASGTGFKVQLNNGDPYDAELIGADTMSDLAVLKINANGLTPAQFGDSSAIEVGESVVAIGNPGGLELAGSVTSGIVSAVNREVRIASTMTFIQTDAAINPGNSGGALANEYGQVIGINSNKIVAPEYEGIGFAIPISEAKPIIDDLIKNGKVTGRCKLGITAKEVDEVDARNYGIQMGLSINSIETESDLNSSGIQRGDILTHIDGQRIYSVSDLQKILKNHLPGDTVTLSFYRRLGAKEITFEVDTRLMEVK